MNGIYARQENNIELEGEEIAIAGVGGGGVWVALFLTLSGIEKLHIYDPDEIELHNLNRMPFPPEAEGENKAIAIKKFLQKLRPSLEIHAYPQKFDPIFLTDDPDILLCCVDNEAGRNETYEYCKNRNTKWIKAAASLDHITVTNRQSEWNGGSDEEGYGMPMWVAPVALAAAITVMGARKYQDVDCLKKIEKILTTDV